MAVIRVSAVSFQSFRPNLVEYVLPASRPGPLASNPIRFRLERFRMREMPRVEELGHGVWSLPVPIPGSPLGFTYVYLVSGDEGAVLVDTGWDHDESWEALTRAVERTG